MTILLLISGVILLGLGLVWRHDSALNAVIKIVLAVVGVIDIFKWTQR